MKEAYEKPVLIRRERLAAISAVTVVIPSKASTSD
jgi:hypothetical protein